MTSENLALWRTVEKTDPKHTKPITGKPYKGNSPKPYWIVQKATETFGPCGIGWGIEIVSERVEEGAPGDKVHIAHLRVWYNWQGQRGVVEHVGQTMFCGKNKNGPYTDEDAPKKSVTDALIKALSMVGFAGDIFLGRYDDSKYVNEVSREFDGAAPVAANELTNKDLDLAVVEQDLIAGIEKCRSGDEVTRFTGTADNIRNYEMLDALAQERVSTAVSKRRYQLSKAAA